MTDHKSTAFKPIEAPKEIIEDANSIYNVLKKKYDINDPIGWENITNILAIAVTMSISRNIAVEYQNFIVDSLAFSIKKSLALSNDG